MPTTHPFDLEAYFRRIGYAGRPRVSLDTLRALHQAHAECIPFENLDPLLRRPVSLAPEDLSRKLIDERRGGYCFEHNLLFRAVLDAIGFRTTGLAARVLLNQPEGAEPPRGHMLLVVDLDEGRFVCDVGFGGLTLTTPLRLEPGVEQATSIEPFRLVPAGDEIAMQALVRGAWRTLYRFALQAQARADYEVTSWYLCHHPASPFLNGLMAARPAGTRRYALRNAEFAIHTREGETTRRTLRTPAQVREVLEEDFGIALPAEPGLDEALARVLDAVSGSGPAERQPPAQGG